MTRASALGVVVARVARTNAYSRVDGVALRTSFLITYRSAGVSSWDSIGLKWVAWFTFRAVIIHMYSTPLSSRFKEDSFEWRAAASHALPIHSLARTCWSILAKRPYKAALAIPERSSEYNSAVLALIEIIVDVEGRELHSIWRIKRLAASTMVIVICYTEAIALTFIPHTECVIHHPEVLSLVGHFNQELLGAGSCN